MSDFQKLLGELTAEAATMSKALPADDSNGDAKIQAAAEEGGLDANKNKDPDADPDADKGGDPMAKSIKVTLPDGTEVEAQDGTELVKSLFARIDQSEDGIGKALTATFDLVKSQAATIESQGKMIKSLSDKVGALSNEGRGRKAILNVIEKASAPEAAATTLAKSEPQGMTGAEFLAKSNAAFDAGKITGLQLNTIDVSLRNNQPIDEGLIRTVLS